MYPHPEHRTYYLTFSRLKTTGTIKLNHKKYIISGESWFDHQKMNLVHQSHLRGWDWFSIQLDNNTEIMLFILRNNKGDSKKYLGGSYITADSKLIVLTPFQIHINILDYWISPKTKIIYPSGWKISIPFLKINLIVTPELKDQELGSNIKNPLSYWEGACKVNGSHGKNKVSGNSYVELVGYDKRLRTKILNSFVN